jgi:hypothetical protein
MRTAVSVLVGLVMACGNSAVNVAVTPTASSCPYPPIAIIHSLAYLGPGPFYVGAAATSLASAGDLNKIPWAVAAAYGSQVTISGKKSDGSAVVNFGFSAQEPGVPVSFQRPDQEGLMIVYQPRLVVQAQPGTFMREGALFWSFPTSGCYEVAADGAQLRERIYVRIGS